MATLQAKQRWAVDDVAQFYKFYKNQETTVSTTFQVFDHGEFYTAHGHNAVLAAKNVFKTPTAIKQLKTKDFTLETVYLGKLNFEALARDLLLVLLYRLEVYRRDANGRWNLAYKASPGNLIEVEDLLFKNEDISSSATGVLSVRYHNEGGQITVHLGFVDATLCEMMYSKFADNSHFTNLESAIIQLGPKECICPKLDSSIEAAKLQEIIKRSNVLLTEQSKSHFHTKNIGQDVQRLLKKRKIQETQKDGSISWTIDYEDAASCVAALLQYLDLMNKEDQFGQYKVTRFDLSQYLKLGSASLDALNLFPEKSTLVASAPSQSYDSLYGLLNHCKTQQGQRLLARWIKQPLVDLNHIEERLSIVEAFVNCSELRMSLSDQHLNKQPDFDKFSKKFLRKRANLQDCFRMYQAVKLLPLLCECIEEHSASLEEKHHIFQEVFMTPIHELLIDFCKFTEMIESTLDFDMVEKHEYLVKPDFDPELQRLRTKMDAHERSMESSLSKAANDLDLEAGKAIKLESTSQFGFVFRMACKEEKKLRNNKKFIPLDTNKAGVRFTNKTLQSISEDLQECKNAYQQQQDAVVMEIVAIAAGYVEPMQILGDLIAQLDVLVSFAQASATAPTPYVRPTLHPMGSSPNRLELVQSRHPCLERLDSVSFIPNDLRLEKDSHDFIIVTGPNMGGKSTYIRQAGVSVLMAQIGCFVPCDKAELCLFDAILARVGAGDCQMQGVSTFMAEMLETASIIRSCTENSLIIIDELGRGTSTYDGFGLAWAISHHIAVELKASCLFATHFHEMTSLADEVQSAVNYHVTALALVDDQGRSSLTMLYQIKPGSCDRSFGIHVAECVGFPQTVLNAAKRKANELEHYFVTSGAPGEVGDVTVSHSEAESKKRRKIKQEGDAIIQKFLDETEAITKSAPGVVEARTELEKLKKGILSSDNAYLRELVSKIEAQAT